jgi:hypothetical protein
MQTEQAIAVLNEKIATLNHQISQTEQKLQTQTMRVPDFNQLRQALERVSVQNRRYQEGVLQTRYLLDEIRDRNRMLDQIEIEESKKRMAQLKAVMPLESENDPDSVLPALLEERKRQQEELEVMLQQPGF